MKQRLIIFLLLLSSVTLSVTAQNTTNVRVRQEGETIVITYDLDKKATISVWVATGQSNQYTELKAVTGSIGKDISAGVNKQIIWQPLQEQTEFVAQNVRFKVEAKSVQYYFSVSETKKVVFSPGNLQYRASTNTWRFAPHQWETIGAANTNKSSTYDGWIDLFGWGTGDNPTKTIKDNVEYQTFTDWGTNPIGTDAPHTWRTLSGDEWSYLFVGRIKAQELFGLGVIGDNWGLIILPDNWKKTNDIAFTPSAERGLSYYGDYNHYIDYNHDNHFFDNIYTISAWQRMEEAGAIFLPLCFHDEFGYSGSYYSCTANTRDYAYHLSFYKDAISPKSNATYPRYSWMEIRLVRDL